MYIYIYLSIYIYIYTYKAFLQMHICVYHLNINSAKNAYVRMNICTCVHGCLCTHVACTYIYICKYACMYVYIHLICKYIHMSMCMYIYMHIYIYR